MLCALGRVQLWTGAELLFEFIEENSDTLALELVGHGASDEAGKSACAHALTNRRGESTGNADGELGSRMAIANSYHGRDGLQRFHGLLVPQRRELLFA
jgi:hypothetical protein